jgi:hypothetical protein
VPPRYDLVRRNIVTALRNPQPDALDVRLWIVDTNKEN